MAIIEREEYTNHKILLIIKDGGAYCTENYVIQYDNERNSVILSAKHTGHELTEDEFLSIEDIENFNYYPICYKKGDQK